MRDLSGLYSLIVSLDHNKRFSVPATAGLAMVWLLFVTAMSTWDFFKGITIHSLLSMELDQNSTLYWVPTMVLLWVVVPLLPVIFGLVATGMTYHILGFEREMSQLSAYKLKHPALMEIYFWVTVYRLRIVIAILVGLFPGLAIAFASFLISLNSLIATSGSSATATASAPALVVMALYAITVLIGVTGLTACAIAIAIGSVLRFKKGFVSVPLSLSLSAIILIVWGTLQFSIIMNTLDGVYGTLFIPIVMLSLEVLWPYLLLILLLRGLPRFVPAFRFQDWSQEST